MQKNTFVSYVTFPTKSFLPFPAIHGIERIKRLFDPSKNLFRGEKNTIIYEVQKRLAELGDSLQIDGIYRIETFNAIKNFEAKNELLADGFLDVLTIEKMFE